MREAKCRGRLSSSWGSGEEAVRHRSSLDKLFETRNDLFLIYKLAQQSQLSQRISRDKNGRQSHGPLSTRPGSGASALDYYSFSANGIRKVPRRRPAHT